MIITFLQRKNSKNRVLVLLHFSDYFLLYKCSSWNCLIIEPGSFIFCIHVSEYNTISYQNKKYNIQIHNLINENIQIISNKLTILIRQKIFSLRIFWSKIYSLVLWSVYFRHISVNNYRKNFSCRLQNSYRQLNAMFY